MVIVTFHGLAFLVRIFNGLGATLQVFRHLKNLVCIVSVGTTCFGSCLESDRSGRRISIKNGITDTRLEVLVGQSSSPTIVATVVSGGISIRGDDHIAVDGHESSNGSCERSLDIASEGE